MVDGEVVAFDGDQTSFQRLGQGGAVFFYVFDVLWLDGRDVRELPLRERKALLRDALTFDDPLRLTEYRNEAGEAMFEEACRKGWEGVIAKRADSPYVDGRSRDWLKFKCEQGQELVIGGFTAPRGSRTEFGALLVGVYDADGALRYAGKVGTGFDHATLALTRRAPARAAPRRRARSPTPHASATPPGSSPSSSPRSASPSGPPPAASATPASKASASTSRRGVSCEKRHRFVAIPGRSVHPEASGFGG